LLPQELVLASLPDGMEKFFIEQGAWKNLRFLEKYHVVLEEQAKDVLKQ